MIYFGELPLYVVQPIRCAKIKKLSVNIALITLNVKLTETPLSHERVWRAMRLIFDEISLDRTQPRLNVFR